jgi:hypothetical protein
MSAAGVMSAVYRDSVVVASNPRWPEIKSLESGGQIVSTDPP